MTDFTAACEKLVERRRARRETCGARGRRVIGVCSVQLYVAAPVERRAGAGAGGARPWRK